MLTQISRTSKVSVPSMFIIQDAQLSHNLTLLSLSSYFPITADGDVRRASGITLTKNGITVQISAVQSLLCVGGSAVDRSVCVCVVVVLWPLCT